MAISKRGTISYGVARNLRTIFKRCVECPNTTPACAPCSNDEICSLVPADCNTCAHMTCIANPTPAPASSGPNVGAIAGGVIGGVLFIASVVWLIWWLWIRKRKQEEDLEVDGWENNEITQQKHATSTFQTMHNTDAASTRTRGSLASSILTRASNIIRIAYIPGVTNRDGTLGSGTNSMLAPPVPPIPAARRPIPRSPLSNNGDALFFRPGDLRDSMASRTSSVASHDRNRDTKYSLTPSLARSSVASSTMYRDDATAEPVPITSVVRAAPRMVAVKSSQASLRTESLGSERPLNTSTQDFGAPGKPKQVQVMVPAKIERLNTGLSLRSNSSYGKPTPVTIGGKSRGRFPVRQQSVASTSASSVSRHLPATSSPLSERDEDSSEYEEEDVRARRSLINTSNEAPPETQPDESPFFDASERPSAAGGPKLSPYAQMSATVGTSADGTPKRSGKGMGGLSAVIEEATRRASRVPSHEGLGGKRDVSPFSDVHATEEYEE